MDARLREGIRLFNEQQFFECHEILEPYYHETEAPNKPFLEGLIQLAAAFRLYREFGEIKGPVRMVHQALVRFENYQPSFLEICVNELSQAAEAWAKAAENAADRVSSALPKIKLQKRTFFS
jgi:predicted metal-dependent hydrolase